MRAMVLQQLMVSRLELPHCLDLVKKGLKAVVINFDETWDNALRLLGVCRTEICNLGGLKLGEIWFPTKGLSNSTRGIRCVELRKGFYVF